MKHRRPLLVAFIDAHLQALSDLREVLARFLYIRNLITQAAILG
jgi:hypothetical protein